MTKNKKPGVSRTLISLISVIPAIWNIINNLLAHVEHDAQLAGRTLLTIVLLCLAFLALLTSAWLGLMGILLVWFVSLHLSWMLSLFIILVFNVLFLIILGLIIFNIKNNLFFPQTCQLLRHPTRIDEN